MVDDVLRSDPVLSRVVNKQGWYSWTGHAQDDGDPNLSNCPWLRITPQAGESDWETEGQHKFPLLIGIELATAGTNSDQITNLWNAVRLALFPQDPAARLAVRQKMNDAGITKAKLTKPAFGVKKDQAQNKLTLAGGVLELLLLIST